MNDLWAWNPRTLNWTWFSGSKDGKQAGVYGKLYVPDQRNVPGGRIDAALVLEPVSGMLPLFGGFAPSGPTTRKPIIYHFILY